MGRRNDARIFLPLQQEQKNPRRQNAQRLHVDSEYLRHPYGDLWQSSVSRSPKRFAFAARESVLQLNGAIGIRFKCFVDYLCMQALEHWRYHPMVFVASAMAAAGQNGFKVKDFDV